METRGGQCSRGPEAAQRDLVPGICPQGRPGFRGPGGFPGSSRNLVERGHSCGSKAPLIPLPERKQTRPNHLDLEAGAPGRRKAKGWCPSLPGENRCQSLSPLSLAFFPGSSAGAHILSPLGQRAMGPFQCD